MVSRPTAGAIALALLLSAIWIAVMWWGLMLMSEPTPCEHTADPAACSVEHQTNGNG